MAERDFDVVVFGATGVTGRQVARYLADREVEAGLSWAAAARNREKLESTLREVGVTASETVIADLGDPDSLRAMASRSRVVLNLVGPYTRYARPVIEACIAGGAHYADLTGEIPFVRHMIDEFDEAARDAGVKIVQVAGFEALPPDLAVLLAAETAFARWEDGLAQADLEVTIKGPPGLPRLQDMISGGTLQSLAVAAADENAAAVTDSAALVTDPVRADEVRRRSPIKVAPRRGANDTVIGPMAPAAFINPAVIHRTAQLVDLDGSSVGPFRYREGVALPGSAATLPLRYAAAGALSATQAGVAKLAQAGPSLRGRFSSGLERILPASGYGPTGERLETWTWRMSVKATTNEGRQVRVDVDAEGHPGYLATARMLGEAGLLLAEPGLTPDRPGCLTPAAALGTDHLERFELARVRFSTSAP